MRFIEGHCEPSCVTGYLYYHLDLALMRAVEEERKVATKKVAKKIDSMLAKKDVFLKLVTNTIIARSYSRQKQNFAVARTHRVMELADFGELQHLLKYDMIHRAVATAEGELKKEGNWRPDAQFRVVKDNSGDEGSDNGGDDGSENGSDEGSHKGSDNEGSDNGTAEVSGEGSNEVRGEGGGGAGSDERDANGGVEGNGKNQEGGDELDVDHADPGVSSSTVENNSNGSPFKTPNKTPRKIPQPPKTPSPTRPAGNPSSPRRSPRNQPPL